MSTVPESHRDLLDAQVATLGTLDGHGRPQLSELWFLAEDDVIQVSLNTARAKVKNLQHNPAFSLLVLDLLNPFRYLELRGTPSWRPTPTTRSQRRSAPSTEPTYATWTSPVNRG
jgi:hypothetical protein